MALLAIGRRIAPPRWCRREPNIMEILSDSIVKAVMEADGIDPKALEAQLRSMAQEIAAVRHAGQIGAPKTAPARQMKVPANSRSCFSDIEAD